jgi:hypothetical protein
MKSIIHVCLIAFVCAAAMSAQATAGSGTITGTIRDVYGDGIPDTDVLIVNQALGFERAISTTDDGVFTAAALIPASGYKLKVSRKGYVDWESGEFSVLVGQTVSFNLGLQAESAASRVQERPAALLDNNTVGVTSPITMRQTDLLPLEQRRLDTLALLAPGVESDADSNRLSFLGQTFSNAILTEGVLTSNTYFTNNSVSRAVSTNQFSADALQELQVVNADPSMEFGHAMNGTVNAVTRSGGAGYHGTAYEYLRLPGLTAVGQDAFGQKLLRGQNQTGASVGGPIPVLDGKLHFFTNFEVLNGRFDAWNRISNPLLADSTGATVSPANCKATTLQCANAIKFIQSQMNVLQTLSQRWINGLAKVDYRLNQSNSFSFEYGLMNSMSPNGLQVANAVSEGGLLGMQNTRDDSRFGKANYILSFQPSVVNELRIGLSQEHIFEPASTSSLSTGDVGISLAGATIGASNPNSSRVSEHRYSLVDNLTMTGGNHTLEVGIDMSKTDYFVNQLDSAGYYTYASLTNFATDLSVPGRNYTLFTQSFGDPRRRLPEADYAFYGQDTWKATRKLTVTFGLRWEKPVVPQPVDQNTSYYQTGSIASPNLDLIPRVGVAYMVDRKTVVRAGYGFFFAPFTGQFLDALFLGNAIYQTNLVINPTLANAVLFPKVVSSLPAAPSGTADVMYSSSKLRNPHSQRATVSIERELTSSTTLSASFIDNRGYKLWTATDTNLATPTKTGTYTIDDANGNKVGTFTTPIYTAKNDGNYAHIYDVENGGSSWYNALAVELRHRMSRDLTVQASYTLSHAIDDVAGPLVMGGIPLITSDPAYTTNRADSATDRHQQLAINAVWSPNFSHSDSFVARYLINGWQFSTIGTLGSSLPETPTVVASGQQLSGITPAFPTTIDGSGAWDRVPFYSVDSLRTGAMYNWNARFTRTIPFSERIKGSLMFEVFNILNSQWTTGVNTLAFTAVSGVLKPVPGVGAANASVSYPYGTNARNCQVAFRVTF